MTCETPVKLEVADSIAVVTLNRPQVLNALNNDMAKTLGDIVGEVRRSREIRALVLRGEGRVFCAGGDISPLAESRNNADLAIESLSMFHPVVAALHGLRIPTVASVHGHVAGAGVALMLACDFAIAADNTKLNLAFSKIGASMDSGTSWLLTRAVGIRRAKEIAILCRTVNAETALRIGLLTELTPLEGLAAATSEFAAALAAGPTAAYAEIKSLIGAAEDVPLEKQLDLEQAAFGRSVRTPDFNEGVNAFREKRQPEFVGF